MNERSFGGCLLREALRTGSFKTPFARHCSAPGPNGPAQLTWPRAPRRSTHRQGTVKRTRRAAGVVQRPTQVQRGQRRANEKGPATPSPCAAAPVRKGQKHGEQATAGPMHRPFGLQEAQPRDALPALGIREPLNIFVPDVAGVFDDEQAHRTPLVSAAAPPPRLLIDRSVPRPDREHVQLVDKVRNLPITTADRFRSRAPYRPCAATSPPGPPASGPGPEAWRPCRHTGSSGHLSPVQGTRPAFHVARHPAPADRHRLHAGRPSCTVPLLAEQGTDNAAMPACLSNR